jgi:hypothetical protein
MMIVSEQDIERVAWSNPDNDEAIAREGGAKAYNVPHPHLDQSL